MSKRSRVARRAAKGPQGDGRPRGAGSGSARAQAGGILLLASFLACGPLLWHDGLPDASDLATTSGYLHGFMKAFGEGDLLPRWLDRVNQSFGAPVFLMFPPLPWYLAAGCTVVAGSMVGGFKLFFLLVTILAAVSFYLLARDWIASPIPAAVAAAVYVLLPYRILDVYFRFALSETAAFIFLPLVLMFARRCMKGEGRWAFTGLSLSYAALVLTHIVSAFAFTLFLGPWLLVEAFGRWRTLVPAAAALACGLGISAPILLPAVVEKSHANIQWLQEMPGGDYKANFIFRDEVMPILGIKNPVKPMVLKSAHGQLALGLIAGILALRLLAPGRRGGRRDVVVLIVACAASYLLQVPLSEPLWELIPELPSIQFPFRFQILSILASALLLAYALRGAGPPAEGAEGSAPRWRAIVLGTMAALFAANGFFAWENAHQRDFNASEAHLNQTRVIEIIESAFTPVEFIQYEDLWGYKFANERVPLDQAAFFGEEGKVFVRKWESSTRLLEVDSPGGGQVKLRSFWFPGWTGRIDEAPLELRPGQGSGVVIFAVPPGRHLVELHFGATPVRRAAWAIGGIACLGLAALVRWKPGGIVGTPLGQAGEAAGSSPA